MLRKKMHQRGIGFPFDSRCAQFDLECAAVLANDNIALCIWHNVNPQNCHSPDHIRAEVNLLGGFGAACDDMQPKNVLGDLVPNNCSSLVEP